MQTFPPYVVLNCHVTQILGFYDTAEKANAAAEEFGNCSFAHALSESERAALVAQD